MTSIFKFILLFDFGL